AKALPVPIFHVNGDDPEALVYVCDLALQFRQEFLSDCVVDVFCFRKHGHNETDEPSFTQPYMYRLIKDHPGVGAIYGRHCAETGVISEQERASITQKHVDALKKALQREKAEPVTSISSDQGPEWHEIERQYSHEQVDTKVAESTLRNIGSSIMEVPEGFGVHRTLARILSRKKKAFETESLVDWSLAEALAFGSLLLEDVPVRLTGEDSVRGTFSQRHLTWWDVESEQPRRHTPLKTLAAGHAKLAAFDSPLSEYAVLGFEYGYSLVTPNVLVAWEAQFGDFANGAQVIIDNYIASAESKWDRSSGLVLLLPHGSEGQGPDHSSAHLERFLQLAAGDNIQVCNVTTPAQYFHVLRRQVKMSCSKPLILMTPKSLLRHPKVISRVGELANGGFQEVLDDSCNPEQITRILLCSGKVYYDLLGRREETGRTDSAIVRVEMLYPFPERALRDCIEKYAKAEAVIWVQEEHKNYGAWAYMRERFSLYFPEVDLDYIGRDESASSATGLFRQFQAEQKKLIEDAL
ncbi:MAG: 2-oxoglutarate dehydrogenase E1 component, partial [Phycisphaerales bacterium]